MAGQIIAWIKQELVPSGSDIDHCKVEFFREKVRFHFRKEGRVYRQELSLF